MLELFKDKEVSSYNLVISVAEKFSYKNVAKVLENSHPEKKKAFYSLSKLATEESNVFKLTRQN